MDTGLYNTLLLKFIFENCFFEINKTCNEAFAKYYVIQDIFMWLHLKVINAHKTLLL